MKRREDGHGALARSSLLPSRTALPRVLCSRVGLSAARAGTNGAADGAAADGAAADGAMAVAPATLRLLTPCLDAELDDGGSRPDVEE